MPAFSPQDALESHEHNLPEEILAAVNTLLSERVASGRVTITQPELLELVTKDGKFTSAEIFARKWFDFEGVYRKAGWKVSYDKPDYNGSGNAYWTFEAKK